MRGGRRASIFEYNKWHLEPKKKKKKYKQATYKEMKSKVMHY